MNKIIKSNLEHLFYKSKESFEVNTIQDLIAQIISDESKTRFFNIDGSSHVGIQGEDLTRLTKFRNSKDVQTAFERLKSGRLDVENIKSDLKLDLIKSFDQVRNLIATDKIENHEHGVIFLEHDFEPFAYLRAYDAEDLPIFDTPQHYNFNLNAELYAGVGRVNYNQTWKYLLNFENYVEEHEVEDFIFESRGYKHIKNSVLLFTYIIVHEVFEDFGSKIFREINRKKTLMIYGNEHDCESINIYAFE